MVESHLGGVRFRRVEPDADWLYCDECGMSDLVSGRSTVDATSPIGRCDDWMGTVVIV